MGLIPLVAWIAALVVALVVLGFCAYEIIWKTRRLQGDVARLQELGERMGAVQDSLAVTRERLAAARER